MAEFVVISGMSGAGRTTAANALEDLGWFVIDNLPPVLLPKMAELAARPGSDIDRVALVAGASSFVDELPPAIEALKATGAAVRVVFLDAGDQVLIRRFGSTRRPHPMSDEGVIAAIAEERETLAHVKDIADLTIDTSELSTHQLRHRLGALFTATTEEGATQVRLAIMSFGYKNGIPTDADYVIDVRFLPNPFWVTELRPKTGLDSPVRDYVLGQESAQPFVESLSDLLSSVIPSFEREGKAYLTVAIGCTGGRHRSVVVAEEVAKRLESAGYAPSVAHRDVLRAD
jgi:UPF0042 nucleotide-binding protein